MESPSRLVWRNPRTFRGLPSTNLDGDFICNKNCFFVRNFSFAKSFLRKSENKKANRPKASFFIFAFSKKLRANENVLWYHNPFRSLRWNSVPNSESQDQPFFWRRVSRRESDDPSKQVAEQLFTKVKKSLLAKLFLNQKNIFFKVLFQKIRLAHINL